METRIVRVGNSKGIRIPKELLLKYGFGEVVSLKEVDSGLLIEKRGDQKLSWEETYKAMAASDEDWSEWSELDLEELE